MRQVLTVETPDGARQVRVQKLFEIARSRFFRHSGKHAKPGKVAIGEWNWGGGSYESCDFDDLQEAGKLFEEYLNERGWGINVHVSKWLWFIGCPTLNVIKKPREGASQ